MLKHSKLLAFSAIAALVSGPVLAQSAPEAGDVAESLMEQGGQISALIGVAAFVAGVGMAFAGLMNFWTMAKTPNDPSAKMSTAFILMSSAAFAQSAPQAGAIAGSLREQGSQISALIGVAAFVAGVGMAFAGLMKSWTMAKNPNDPSAKMSTAFILKFVGGALAALPTVMGSGINMLLRNNNGKPQLTNATSLRSIAT